MAKVHYKGKVITESDIANNQYLKRYKKVETLCGYLFMKEDKVTITSKKTR
jgi:hypothetical protein